MRAIIERIEAGSEVIANDVANVRELIANGGMISRFFQFIMGATRTKKSSSKRASSKN